MLTTKELSDRKSEIGRRMIPNKNGAFSEVTQALTSLARLTIRQLRQMASDLGVTLYSRKSKKDLLNAIAVRQEKRESDQLAADPSQTEGNSPLKDAAEADITPATTGLKENSTTRVVFLPRDPQWAYVFWEISEADRKRALAQGANRLCLRLADVTGSQNGTANRQTLQEVAVDSHSTEWYLPIPLCDRDYRVELGYRFGNSWMSLAFSSVAHVPALHPSEQILDQFVPFSLDATPMAAAEASIETLTADPSELSNSGLHERLYQSATTHFRTGTRRVGSEEFQEHSFGNSPQKGLSDSGIGLWASGRNESGLGGVAPRQRAFWLVADAELIVYGATDPSARLTIGNEDVPLSKDGTFRIQVPFRDGEQVYAMEATAADGEQKRSITLNFERTTPKDNTNPASQSKAEWF